MGKKGRTRSYRKEERKGVMVGVQVWSGEGRECSLYLVQFAPVIKVKFSNPRKEMFCEIYS